MVAPTSCADVPAPNEVYFLPKVSFSLNNRVSLFLYRHGKIGWHSFLYFFEATLPIQHIRRYSLLFNLVYLGLPAQLPSETTATTSVDHQHKSLQILLYNSTDVAAIH